MTHSHAAPGLKPLAAIAAVVVAAHVLVLQTSPAQLGKFGDKADFEDAAGKTFATRSIEAPTAPAAAPVQQTVPVAPAAPKIKPNRPFPHESRAQTAPDLIAKAVVPPLAPALESLAENTATSLATATASVPQASATSATSAIAFAEPASASLPAGPQATLVTAVNLPGSARLQYKVVGLSKSLNYQATAELIWKAAGDKYEAALKVSAFLVGSRSMTSVGQITATGLAPTRFADKSRTELAAHFDAAKGKITFSANTPDAPWVEGAQDRVSVFLQLGGIIAAKPAEFAPGASVTLYTVGPREAESWTFAVEAQESLDLLGAPMQTLKLTRKPRRDFDQKVEVWYAPALGYLPVRNRITQPGGDFVDQQLSEIGRS
jgi:Protein of unknown function (DUF3108)